MMILTSLVAAAITLSPAGHESPACQIEHCVAYTVSTDNDPVATCLTELGFTGDPTDGREAIIAPDSDITACTEDAWNYQSGQA